MKIKNSSQNNCHIQNDPAKILIKAAKKNDTSTILSLTHGQDFKNVSEKEKLKALAKALTNSAFEAAHLLLKNGVSITAHKLVQIFSEQEDLPYSQQKLTKIFKRATDIDEINEEEETPLMAAVRAGSQPLVVALIKNGADVLMQTELKETAILAAIDSDQMKLMRQLKKHGASYTLETLLNHLSLEIETRSPELSKELIEGASDFKDDKQMRYALNKAIQTSHLNAAQYLLELGAPRRIDKFSGSHDLATQLLHQQNDRPVQIWQLLFESIENLDALGRDGSTLLIHAIQQKKYNAIKALLKIGADLEATAKNGRSAPLYAAVKAKNMKAAKLLLKAGANVHNDDNKLDSLSKAIFLGNIEMTRLLLAHEPKNAIFKKNGNSAFTDLKRRYHLQPWYQEIKALFTPESKKMGKAVLELIRNAHFFHLSGKLDFTLINGQQITLDLDGGEFTPVIATQAKKAFDIFQKSDVQKNDGKLSAKTLETISQALHLYERFSLVPNKSIVKEYLSKKPILIPTGFKKHRVTCILSNDLAVIINRGDGMRKAIEVAQLSEKTAGSQKRIFKYLNKLYSLEQASKNKYKKFIKNNFSKMPSSTLCQILEENLALPEQVSGNCSWASLEGALLFLFATETLREKNLLIHTPNDEEMRQIKETIEAQKDTFKQFIELLQNIHKKKAKKRIDAGILNGADGCSHRPAEESETSTD